MVYISKWWLAFSPLPSERKKNILPKTILTPSRFLLKVIQKNDPKINVRKTGAFRYPKPMSRITNDGLLRILVPLSHNIDDALNSIYKTRSILIELSKESKTLFNVTYKSHPAAEKSALWKLSLEKYNEKETWTERPLAEELRTADIVLGERTFALLESLNAGVPVGVIRSQDGLFHSSIPPSASSDQSLNIDSLETFKRLIKIARRRRSSEHFLEKPVLEIPSRNLALEVFGLR
jgi:hypothetical protein